jgi:signal transduction histidine kinase
MLAFGVSNTMNRKILVVEDEPTILENILETLELEGFDVRGAHNGAVGVNTASEYVPNLVICDIMMPELDGYDVLSRIRSNPDLASTPFIFLTAKAERQDMRKGMELGADDYLIKPFTTSELLAAVEARFERQSDITEPLAAQIDTLRDNITRALPHELRTPLTGILGYTELLMMGTEGMPDAEIQSMIRQIHDSSERLHHLIEKYLMFAQVNLAINDQPRIERWRSTHRCQAAAEIKNAATAKAKEANRAEDLVLEVQEMSARILGDNLKAITEELVQNAFKFSKAGTKVEVKLTKADNMAQLTITDHGRGMSETEIQNIGAYMQFQRAFYEQQGLGLGMTIAHHLTQIYNGTVRIDSVPNSHTTVTVKLPLVT